MKKLTWAALAATLLTPASAWASDQCVVMPDGSAVQPVAAPMPPAPRGTPNGVSLPPPVTADALETQPRPGATAQVPSGPVVATETHPARRNTSDSGADPAIQGGLHLLSDAEMAKLPAVRQLQRAGYKLFVLGHATGDAPDVFAERGNQFQAIYPTPDPRYRCEGVLKDEAGHNVTLDQVKTIPGVLPPPGRTPPPAITTAGEALEAMAKGSLGTYGPAGAPQVWAVIDPLCVHSQDAVRALLPAAHAGQIQLVLFPVAMLSAQSVPTAEALVSAPPGKMAETWLRNLRDAPRDATSSDKVRANTLTLVGMSAGLGIRGVPALFWRDAGGNAHMQSGLDPAKAQSFIAGILG